MPTRLPMPELLIAVKHCVITGWCTIRMGNLQINVISLKLRGTGHWNVQLLSSPVRDKCNVLLSGTTGNVQLSIHDINGKIIYTKSLQNINGQISLPAILQKGIYILEAVINNVKKNCKVCKMIPSTYI